MLQGISLQNQIKFSSKPLAFGNTSTLPKKDKIGTVESTKDSNILMTSLMLGGAAAAGILGHKMYVSKFQKAASETAESLSSASETLHQIVVKDFNQTALHAKFEESKKSLLGFIKETQAKPEEMKEFLFGITSHPEKSQEFVKEITQDARQSQGIVKTLVQKVGGQKNFVDWYFAPQGYQQAYAKHIEKVFESAQKPEDLFSRSPNWNYHRMTEKFGDDFTAGQLPQELENTDKYRDVVGRIILGQEGEIHPGIVKVKEVSEGISDKRVCILAIGDKKYVLKVHHDFEAYVPKLKESNQALLTDENTSWLNDAYFKKHKENELMKSDSTFIDAQIDFYLKSHNNHDVAEIHFYDNQTKSSLYEFVEGGSIREEDANLVSLNRKAPDLAQIGIVHNDVKPENYREVNGKLKGIDSGESSYADVLRPGCAGYHSVLPNWSGRDIVSCLAGLNLDKI